MTARAVRMRFGRGARRVAAAALLAAVTSAVACNGAEAPSASAEAVPELAVALHTRDALALIDPRMGVVARIATGAAPWGVAVTRGYAYVSTARHVAVVDLKRRRLVARVAYRTRTGRPERGEYRSGGMGIAVSRDGRRVFVGVHPAGGGPGRLETLDTSSLRIVATAPIGERPFDVMVSRDGDSVFTVDHDSYSVTVVDTRTMATRTLPVSPLGSGAFDKLNYGALDRRGRLLLPINGEVLAILDPRTGAVKTRRMRSRVHQAGAVFDRGRLITIGAEPLEGDRGPNLSLYDLDHGRERVFLLKRPHEDLAVSRNGREAYLTGGYTRGGWDGITVVDLARGSTREIRLAGQPLGLARL